MDNVTLHNRDCLEVMKELPSESVDLFITDCPYRISGGGSGMARGMLNRNNYVKDSHGNKVKEGTKHVNLCGIFDEDKSTTYVQQGKLRKETEQMSLF